MFAGSFFGRLSLIPASGSGIMEPRNCARVTVFLGCGFAAKYRESGAVFSVPQMRA